MSIWRLLAGVRLRRRDEGVGWAPAPSRPPKARPALAGVRPRPEKVRKSPGAGPFCPSVALVVGVKSRLTPSPAGTRAGVAIWSSGLQAAAEAAAGGRLLGRLQEVGCAVADQVLACWSDVACAWFWPASCKAALQTGAPRGSRRSCEYGCGQLSVLLSGLGSSKLDAASWSRSRCSTTTSRRVLLPPPLHSQRQIGSNDRSLAHRRPRPPL